MIKNIFYACVIALISISLRGAPGCMDNSQHLAEKFDNKEYHYVQCNCPCQKLYELLADRAQCAKCFHYRVPQRMIIVSHKDQLASKESSQRANAQTAATQTQDPELKKLFGRYNYK